MSARFSASFVESESQIDPTLWDACFAPPIEGRWWYATLEQCGLEDQFSFLYGVIHRDGVAVGIAPAFVMDVPLALVAPPGLLRGVEFLGRTFPSLVRPRTLFVGSPCADEGTVGMAPGIDSRSALFTLQQAFEAQARDLGAVLLVWKDFPATYAADLDWLAQQQRLFRAVSYPGTIVEFPVRSKEAYFAALKGRRRHTLKKKLRRSAEQVEIRVESRANGFRWRRPCNSAGRCNSALGSGPYGSRSPSQAPLGLFPGRSSPSGSDLSIARS